MHPLEAGQRATLLVGPEARVGQGEGRLVEQVVGEAERDARHALDQTGLEQVRRRHLDLAAHDQSLQQAVGLPALLLLTDLTPIQSALLAQELQNGPGHGLLAPAARLIKHELSSHRGKLPNFWGWQPRTYTHKLLATNICISQGTTRLTNWGRVEPKIARVD
jgi:hypothetical protein